MLFRSYYGMYAFLSGVEETSLAARTPAERLETDTLLGAIAAIDALLAGAPPVAAQVPSLGCNIKWKPGQEPSYFHA